MIIGSQIAADVIVRGATSAESQLIGVGAASDSAGAKLAGLALGGAALATGALIGIGAISLKMAADFQQGVTRLRTGAGDTQDSFAALSASILKVSTSTGILTPQLIASDYLILSSGQRGTQAYDTLAAAAQGAVIEQAKVVDVTQILTTLQTNFGLATYSATQYMDGLISAVKNGKITLENLSTAMSPILPNAKALGIHFADVAAAMSDMTNQGIPADQAATALRFVFQSMIMPTKASTAAMKEWGLNSDLVATTMKTSLPDALQMYIDAALRAGPEGSKPFIDALSQMMGGGQRAAKALFSLSQSMGIWKTDIGQINTAMRDTSPTVSGWALAQSNLNVQIDKAHAALDAVFIKIGTDLMPIASAFLQNVVMPAITHFSDWATNTTGLHDTFVTLASVLGNVISGAETLVTATAAVVTWFQKAGPQGTILKDVLIGVAGAVAAIKFTEMALSLATLATVTIPAALVKFGFLTVAEEATGTAATGATTQLTLWTGEMVTTGGAADILAGKLSAVKAVLGGLQIGMAAFAASGMFPDAPHLDPNSDIYKAYLAGETLAAYEKHKQAIIDVANAIQVTAEKQLEATLVTNYNNYLQTLNKNQQINDQIMTQNHLQTQAATYKLNGQYYALKLLQAQTNSTQLEKLMEQNDYNILTHAAYFWTGMNTVVQNGVNKDYQIVAAGFQNAADIAASKMKEMAIQVQNKWNDINAILNHQINVNVNTNYTSSGTPGPGGGVGLHAAGGLNIPAGLSWVGERGPELINVPRGSDIYPHALSLGFAARAAAPVIHVHVQSPDMYLDGVRFSRSILPNLASALRYNTSMGFGR